MLGSLQLEVKISHSDLEGVKRSWLEPRSVV